MKRAPILFTFSPWATLVVMLLTVGNYTKAVAQKPLAKIAEETDSLKAIEGEFVRKLYVLPIVTVAPETSVEFGVVGVLLFRKKGVSKNTQLSTIRLPISYTLNKQFRIKLGATYYSNANRNLLAGSGEYFEYPLFFYGLGNATAQVDEEIYTTRTLLIDLSYLKSLAPNLFVGIGYNYLNSDLTEVVPGGQLSEPGVVPGNRGSKTSGFSVNMRFDSRDNHLSAVRGTYLDLRVATYQPWSGSEYAFTQLNLDLRQYVTMFHKHVLAMQVVLTNTWGAPPFERMALLGGKTIMRGHYLGRFRDNSLYSAQVEYRLPLGRDSWIDERQKVPFSERWGLVGFLGFGDVYGPYSNADFSSIKGSAGIGIRYLVLPKERINVRIDFGFGSQVPGFYFGIREAF